MSAIVVHVVLAAIVAAIAAALGAGLLALVIIPIGILLAGWGAAEGRLAHENRERRTPGAAAGASRPWRPGRIRPGKAVGSEATAMCLYELPPGESSSSYHYEYVEEWLLVLDGTIVVRAPDGEQTLVRGDLVCFPAGPLGAHKLMNRAESAARILVFSNRTAAGRGGVPRPRHDRRVARW